MPDLASPDPLSWEQLELPFGDFSAVCPYRQYSVAFDAVQQAEWLEAQPWRFYRARLFAALGWDYWLSATEVSAGWNSPSDA